MGTVSEYRIKQYIRPQVALMLHIPHTEMINIVLVLST